LIIWFEIFYQNKRKEGKRQINRMNPTLISGFEDVITHINQQDQRVMSLEEENKKLKEELEEKEVSLINSEEMENEEKIDQQEEWFKEINILVGADEDEPAVNSVMDFVAEYKKFQEENEKLGAEIKKFQEENEKLEAKVLRLQSSEQDLEKKLDTGGWSPTSSPEPKQ
jgi:cell shape-determining protein MreC